jgi:hypothetical protein
VSAAFGQHDSGVSGTASRTTTATYKVSNSAAKTFYKASMLDQVIIAVLPENALNWLP